MKRLVLLVSMVWVLSVAVAQAAWVDPVLEEQLQAAPAGAYVGAYVILKDRVDVAALVRQLDAEKAAFAQRHYDILTTLQDHAFATQEPVLAWLDDAQLDGQVESYRPFWIDNAIGVRATAEFFAALRDLPEIGKIYFDYPLDLIEPVRMESAPRAGKGVEVGIEITRAPELWALGIDGTGTIAADMDTGADGSHPAVAARWRGLIADPAECWYDPSENEPFPHDYWTHGTHTLGTMVGLDGDNQIGMAPGALWIASAVIDVPYVDIFTEAVASFEWFADPDGNPGTTDDVPAVVNNSWGIAGFPHCADDFWAAIDVCEAAGVAVVFAAGNEGPMGGSLRSPADRIASIFNVFSVGALKPNGTGLANFSSRGPSKCDWTTIKPEVCAVGVEVRSSLPGEEYGTMDGTSMAAPHVSGAIMLLRQAFPDATVDELKAALYFTAVDLGPAGEENDFGRGRIDVMAAYEFLLDACDHDGDGYDGSQCAGNDCNDYDATVYPGAAEICDGQLNNCGGTLPNDEIDHDADGVLECAGDCAPNDAEVFPGHREICDGKDNNCDEVLPEDEQDPDGDGVAECAGDCLPADETVFPGAPELCDGKDNNCNGELPPNEIDADLDGYRKCEGDCRDGNPEINPGAVEDCWDHIDNNCDGLMDGEDPTCQSADDDDDDDDDNDDASPSDDDESPAGDDDNDDNDSGGCS
jgi:bacillopeptidase F